jgi:hypothetical protein
MWCAARWLYWSGATIYGALGIVSGCLGLKLADGCGGPMVATEFLRLYLMIRLIAGILQIAFHVFVLCPARLNQHLGRRLVVHVIGNGDAQIGLDRFFGMVTVCNGAMAITVGFVALAMHELGQCADPLAASIYWIEGGAMVVLLYTLGLRLLAALLGQTRSWFGIQLHDVAAPLNDTDTPAVVVPTLPLLPISD